MPLKRLMDGTFPSVCFQNKVDAGLPVSMRILGPSPGISLLISANLLSLSVMVSGMKKSSVLCPVLLGSQLCGCLQGGLLGKQANWQGTRQLVSF